MTDSKTKTAKNILNSWIRSSGVKTTHVPGADVGIITPSGPVGIKVSETQDDGVVCISAIDIANRSNRSSVKFFYGLMDSLGVSYNPVHRGNIEDLDKRTYDGRDLPDGTSEIELTYMRHLEFRSAPDLTQEDWKLYSGCVNTAARLFYNRNYTRLNRLLIEMDDLVQYGRVWTVNFLHRYRKDTVDATSAILMNYLKHRFAEFFKLMCRQEVSFQPSLAVLNASTYADKPLIFDQGSQEGDDVKHYGWSIKPDIEVAMELIEEDGDEEPQLAYRTRAKHAQNRLSKIVAGMDRKELLSKLQEAAKNDFIAPDAQELAARLLSRLEGETQEHA